MDTGPLACVSAVDCGFEFALGLVCAIEIVIHTINVSGADKIGRRGNSTSDNLIAKSILELSRGAYSNAQMATRKTSIERPKRMHTYRPFVRLASPRPNFFWWETRTSPLNAQQTFLEMERDRHWILRTHDS